MFGKRKQDHKHRFAEEDLGDDPGDAARAEDEQAELHAALRELGRNRHAALPVPDQVTTEPVAPDAPAEPVESSVPEQPSFLGRGVPTAAMLAEPEPEPESDEPEPTSVGEVAAYAALRRERAKAAEQEAALQKAKDEAAALKAELKQFQAAASATDAVDIQEVTARADELEQSLVESQKRVEELTAEVGRLQSTDAGAELKSAQERAAEFERSQVESQVRIDALTADLERARSETSTAGADEVRAATERAEAAERTVLELQSKVASLTAELERSRSEAAAAGVALERVEREAKDQDGTVAAAEDRAEKLAAEVEKLRAEAAKGPAQVERLRREADREKALRAALEQAQAAHAQAEAALADNRRLASDLAMNLQSQEGLIAALTGLQTEVTEQRAWFEAQIANLRETEDQQASVVDALQAAIQDRDVELELLRQQLLEAEAKRAEEAAAFVAALERQ